MVTVTIWRESARVSGFEVSGHAGYADAGEDIVCSAVSVLTQTALLGLTEVLKLDVEYHLEPGRLTCRAPREREVEVQAILETMALGLSQIAQAYGDYVELIVKTE